MPLARRIRKIPNTIFNISSRKRPSRTRRCKNRSRWQIRAIIQKCQVRGIPYFCTSISTSRCTIPPPPHFGVKTRFRLPNASQFCTHFTFSRHDPTSPWIGEGNRFPTLIEKDRQIRNIPHVGQRKHANTLILSTFTQATGEGYRGIRVPHFGARIFR